MTISEETRCSFEPVIFFELVDLYSLVVLAAVFLSWFPAARDNPVGAFIERATEPVFEKIRRVVPPLGGFDLSPMLLLLALQLLKRLLVF